MSNMSYCRFENTLKDLEDCLNALTDPVSAREHKFRRQLVEIARELVDTYDGALEAGEIGSEPSTADEASEEEEDGACDGCDDEGCGACALAAEGLDDDEPDE